MNLFMSFAAAIVLLTASANPVFSQTNTHQTTDSLTTTAVKVKGITCAMDLKMIAASVEKLTGVSSCQAGKKGTTTTFEIRYNPALVSQKEIFTAIESTGSCENPDERPYKIKQ